MKNCTGSLSSRTPRGTLTEDISKIQSEFYASHPQAIFFRKGQKTECAHFVTEQVPLARLFSNSVYVIPGTDNIYVDYPIIKSYVTHTNYAPIVRELIRVIHATIEHYGGFNLHVNLLSFSVSAAERYTDAIKMFCAECSKTDIRYLERMHKMYIYNTPHMIHLISAFMIRFTNDSIKEKMVHYSKEESATKIQTLHAHVKSEN
jgi:hypothetical protein